MLADPLISPFVRERQWGAVAAGVEITQASGLSGVDSTSTVGAGGADYTSGDIVSIDTGSSLAVVRVTFTAPGGAVAAFEVLASGSGYSAATLGTTNIEVANPAAAGFTVDVVVDTDLETYSIAQVADGTYTPSTDPVGDAVSATLHVEGAYTETKFGNCSFDTRDFYGKEPVQIIASVLDETGDPCSDCGTVVNTPGTMASTIGETVLRDILMTEAYMQSPYNQGNVDSSRIREIEGSNDILASVDRTALYKTYVIQHTVPRFNNPTGVFDNDQYLYKIYVKCADEATIQEVEVLMTDIQDWANANGNPVQFITDIDGGLVLV